MDMREHSFEVLGSSTAACSCCNYVLRYCMTESVSAVFFEWNAFNAKLNYRKHKVSFELAQLAFQDPLQLTDFDRTVAEEDRFNTLARVANIVLFVSHCYRKNENGEEVIRIISARKAERREHARYYRQIT